MALLCSLSLIADILSFLCTGFSGLSPKRRFSFDYLGALIVNGSGGFSRILGTGFGCLT